MKLSHALLVGCLVVAGLTSPDAHGERSAFGSGSQNKLRGCFGFAYERSVYDAATAALPGRYRANCRPPEWESIRRL